MKHFIRFFLLAMICVAYASAGSAKAPSLKVGDLLFKAVPSDSAFSDAVVQSTQRSDDNRRVSHVGVLTSIRNGKGFVTEAVFSGVQEIPLSLFISKKPGDKTTVIVARLKPPYRGAIAPAIRRIKALVGKPYDREFIPDNDRYYCSELIACTFRLQGQPIFPSKPMTFKNLDTGKTSQLWIDYFKELGEPIPEGVEGTNPIDLLKSPVVEQIMTIRSH